MPKKPFSGKAKKKQLQAKRQQRQEQRHPRQEEEEAKEVSLEGPLEDRSQLKTVFQKVSRATLAQLRRASHDPIHRTEKREAPTFGTECAFFGRPYAVDEIPQLPCGSALEELEEQAFRTWKKEITTGASYTDEDCLVI